MDQIKGQLTSSLKENADKLKNILDINTNFDIIYKEMRIGGKDAGFFFIDGFVKDDVMQKLMSSFEGITEDKMTETAEEFSKQWISYVEVDMENEIPNLIRSILSGVVTLLIEGYDKALEIDCRTYPMRGVEEPEKDRVMRGSRDGFVETVVFNTALIRRRIRNPELSMEITSVGKSSKTDIVISYMKDRVDQSFLQNLKERIQNIQIDSLTMNQQSLAECLYKRSWFNPFPKFKYTERPDTASASLLEGNIVVLIDNSPSAMILPTSVFDIIEEAVLSHYRNIFEIFEIFNHFSNFDIDTNMAASYEKSPMDTSMAGFYKASGRDSSAFSVTAFNFGICRRRFEVSGGEYPKYAQHTIECCRWFSIRRLCCKFWLV